MRERERDHSLDAVIKVILTYAHIDDFPSLA